MADRGQLSTSLASSEEQVGQVAGRHPDQPACGGEGEGLGGEGDAVAEPGSGGLGDVALDDGDVASVLLLGGGVPASGGEPVVEHRRLLRGPDLRVLAGELDVGGEVRLHGRDA